MPEKAKSGMLMAQTKTYRLKGVLNMTYTMKNGYRLPDLLPPQEPEVHLGKYALLRRRFLKERRPVMFTNLLTTGRLNEHLMEIQQTAQRRVEQITAQMAKAEGVTEELKARDQMQWVGRMNNIRACAREIVNRELIYQQ